MNQKPPANDDEALSALLDGVLPAEEERALHARLIAEPALERRYARLRRANAAVRAAYAPVADEPLPENVVKLLRPKVVPLQQRVRAAPLRLPVAVAASVALAAGVLLSYFVLPRTRPASPIELIASGGAVQRGSPLYDVLETRPSRQPAPVGGDATATARLTFKNAAGEYCRQIDVAAKQAAAQAVACRHDGAWRLRVASFGAPARGPQSGTYRPASAAENPVIASAVQKMMAGSPLDRRAERALIAHGWQTNGR